MTDGCTIMQARNQYPIKISRFPVFLVHTLTIVHKIWHQCYYAANMFNSLCHLNEISLNLDIWVQTTTCMHSNKFSGFSIWQAEVWPQHRHGLLVGTWVSSVGETSEGIYRCILHGCTLFWCHMNHNIYVACQIHTRKICNFLFLFQLNGRFVTHVCLITFFVVPSLSHILMFHIITSQPLADSMSLHIMFHTVTWRILPLLVFVWPAVADTEFCNFYIFYIYHSTLSKKTLLHCTMLFTATVLNSHLLFVYANIYYQI